SASRRSSRPNSISTPTSSPARTRPRPLPRARTPTCAGRSTSVPPHRRPRRQLPKEMMKHAHPTHARCTEPPQAPRHGARPERADDQYRRPAARLRGAHRAAARAGSDPPGKPPHGTAVEGLPAEGARGRGGLDRAQLASLASCEWMRQSQNLLIHGATGSGKTYLACALAQQACRAGLSAWYVRAPRLFEELSLCHADGSFRKRLAAIAKIQ